MEINSLSQKIKWNYERFCWHNFRDYLCFKLMIFGKLLPNLMYLPQKESIWWNRVSGHSNMKWIQPDAVSLEGYNYSTNFWSEFIFIQCGLVYILRNILYTRCTSCNMDVISRKWFWSLDRPNGRKKKSISLGCGRTWQPFWLIGWVIAFDILFSFSILFYICWPWPFCYYKCFPLIKKKYNTKQYSYMLINNW